MRRWKLTVLGKTFPKKAENQTRLKHVRTRIWDPLTVKNVYEQIVMCEIMQRIHCLGKGLCYTQKS